MVTHRQLLPVFFFCEQRMGRGGRGGVEMLSLCFYDLSLTALIVVRQGEKEKGPQLRGAAVQISPRHKSDTDVL